MSGISGAGAGGVHQPDAVSGVDGDTAASAASPGSSSTGAPGATASARPRSVDIMSLGLAADLDARLASAGSTEPTKEAVAERVDATPRTFDAQAQAVYDEVVGYLDDTVEDWETYHCLDSLGDLNTDQWMGVLDKLDATPWKGKKTLLDKFISCGIEDDNEYIMDFAEQAAEKLGFNLPSLEDRVKRLRGTGMKYRKAKRVAGRELRRDARALLDQFDVARSKSFGASIVDGAEAVGSGLVKGALLVVLMLSGGLDGPLG